MAAVSLVENTFSFLKTDTRQSNSGHTEFWKTPESGKRALERNQGEGTFWTCPGGPRRALCLCHRPDCGHVTDGGVRRGTACAS